MPAVIYWFSERLRDAWLWPLNLGRDFPARSGRLAKTLLTGSKALLTAPLLLLRAIQSKSARGQLRRGVQQSVWWLHLLLAQLFDLVGGPELLQFFMHLGMHTTPLSPAEQKAAIALFGPGKLRYGDVRLAEGGILNLIFRLNGQLAFATWYTIHLPRGRNGGMGWGNGRQNLPLLIHELTHVFQYHHVGSRYLGEAIFFLVKTRRDCYQYGGPAGLKMSWKKGKSLKDFNREQQAQIVQDYFACSLEKGEQTAFLPYIEQMRRGDL